MAVKAETRRLVVALSVVFALILVGVGGCGLLVFGHGSTKEIEAVADKLQPDPNWTLRVNEVLPPRLMCTDGVCPSIFRIWESNLPLDYQGFQALVRAAGWDFPIVGECLVGSQRDTDPNGYGSDFSCEAKGSDDGYSIIVYEFISRFSLSELYIDIYKMH
jgi:hypothetical protein